MFTNLTDTYLWDIAKPNTKDADTLTPKLFIMGEDRGQTERYLIALSKLLKITFEDTKFLFYANDFHKVREEDYDIKLQALGLTYIPSDLTDTKKREIIKNYPIIKRSLGTTSFVEWIIWMILGWEVVSVTQELPTNLIQFYDEDTGSGDGVISYIEGQTETFVFFDDNAAWILTILPDFDGVDNEIKREWLKSKLKEWFLSSEVNFQ